MDIIRDKEKFSRGWTGGLPETPCGLGSTRKSTALQRPWIADIIKRYEIKSIADIGAGDLNWIRLVDLNGAEYTPYDLVPRHPSVVKFDLLEEVPPTVDMIMCLWVLNHLPYQECQKGIAQLKASRSRYLMMTDRPIWHNSQPPEIHMPSIERIVLNQKQDTLMLIDLWNL